MLEQCVHPENYVTNNRSSALVENLKTVIQETNATEKTDVCKVYHESDDVIRQNEIRHLGSAILNTKGDVNTTPLHGHDRNEVSVLRHTIKLNLLHKM